MLAVLLFFNLLFIIYFFIVKTPILGVIPLLFVIFISLASFSDNENWISWKRIKNFLLDNILTFSWILIQIWFFFFLTYYNLEELKIILWWIGINILLLIISYAFNFKDGKKIFHIWLYFNQLSLLVYLSFKIPFFVYIETLLNIILYLGILNLWIYIFINFIIWIFRKVDQSIKNLLFPYFIIVSIISIYKLTAFNHHLWLFLGQFFIFGILSLLYISKLIYEKNNSIQNNTLPKEKLIEKILNGEKILNYRKKINTISDFLIRFYKYFSNQPFISQLLLSILNILLIFWQIFVLFQNIQNPNNIISYEILYRTAIAIFFTNFLIMKQLKLYYKIQRIFLFFILNFSIYLSLLHIFGKNLTLLIWIAIIWNLANSLVVLFSKDTIFKKILSSADYQIRTFTNIIAWFINLFFIFKLNLDYHLKFSISTIYIGLILFLNIYILKTLEKWKKQKNYI